MTERKAPLGGVDKETFVESAKDAGHNARLTYNVFEALYDEMKKIGDDVSSIKQQCSCRVAECKAEFDMRYLRRFSKNIPFSTSEIVVYSIMFGILVGLGYIAIDKIFKIPI